MKTDLAAPYANVSYGDEALNHAHPGFNRRAEYFAIAINRNYWPLRAQTLQILLAATNDELLKGGLIIVHQLCDNQLPFIASRPDQTERTCQPEC